MALVAAVQQRRRGRLLAATLVTWQSRAADQKLLARQEQTAACRSIARCGKWQMLCTVIGRVKHCNLCGSCSSAVVCPTLMPTKSRITFRRRLRGALQKLAMHAVESKQQQAAAEALAERRMECLLRDSTRLWSDWAVTRRRLRATSDLVRPCTLP